MSENHNANSTEYLYKTPDGGELRIYARDVECLWKSLYPRFWIRTWSGREFRLEKESWESLSKRWRMWNE